MASIIGIHALVLVTGDKLALRCELKHPWLDGKRGNAICVGDESLVTCPWCLGATSKEHAKRMIARMYAERMDSDGDG